MANPFTRNALTELSLKTNITSLGDGEAKVIGLFDLSASVFKDVDVAPIKITTGTGTWGANAMAKLYIAVAELATDPFTDNIDETSSADQASLITECTLADQIEIAAASTAYYFDGFSIASKLSRATMPSHALLLLKNDSATAADDLSAAAGDHIAKASTIAFA